MINQTERISISLFCFFILLFAAFSQETNPRVSVMPFNYAESIDKNDALALTSRFETALVNTGAFIVVKQNAVNVILKAQAFSVQDYVDKNSAIRIGQIIAANHIFMGNIAKLGARLILDVQLIEIEKGQALKAGNCEAVSVAGLFDQMDELAASFAGNSKKSLPEFTNKVKIYIDLGDKFVLEQKYEKALEQYDKALLVEEFNVQIIRKSIRAKLDKMLVNSLYLAHAVNDGLDIALRNDYNYIRFIPGDEIDKCIEQILLLKTLDSAYEKDTALLLDEATVYKVAGKVKDAVKVLEQAIKIAPDNDKITAELGLLYAFQANQEKKENNGITMIRQALKKQPENPLYHLYLARSLDRDNKKINAEAIREYRKAAELALADDFWTKRIHMFAAQSLQRVFYQLGFYPGGILTADLKMDSEERLDHMQYLMANKIPFYSKTDTQNPEFYLASLYLATNRIMEADKMMRTMIEGNKAYWNRHITWLTLFKQILEKGKHDQAFLKEVQEYLDKAQTKTGK